MQGPSAAPSLTERERVVFTSLARWLESVAPHVEDTITVEDLAGIIRNWLHHNAAPAPSSPQDGGSTAEPVVPRSAPVANAPGVSRGAAAIRHPTTPEGSHTPLLPCPFCGGVPHANADISAVNCASCKAIMPRDYRVANAVYWWNQRAPSATRGPQAAEPVNKLYDAGFAAGVEAAAKAMCWRCKRGDPVEHYDGVGWAHSTVPCNATNIRSLAAAPAAAPTFDEGFKTGVEAAAKVAVQSALNAEQHPDSVNGYFAAQTARRIEREIAALTPAAAADPLVAGLRRAIEIWDHDDRDDPDGNFANLLRAEISRRAPQGADDFIEGVNDTGTDADSPA